MILCSAISSYPSDSDIECEFLIEILKPERPCYVKNLLDRLSKLTEGILMVNSSLVNISLTVTARLIEVVHLTIIPRARMGSESTAHSAFGLMGY